MSQLLTCSVVLCGLLAACGETPEDVEIPVPPPATLPGVYSGVYPCANCPGIETTLWLRPDGRFILEQKFQADEGAGDSPMRTHALGRWQWRAGDGVLALTGAGPERLFERPDSAQLLMRSSSSIEHRLERNNAASEFGGTIRLRGMTWRQGDGYVFSECLTGYELPLAKGGDSTRFARQFRSVVPRGQAAGLEIDARFMWADDGTPSSLAIERFVTLRTDSAC